MRTNGLFVAGIGVAPVAAVDTSEAVAAGWWDEDTRQASGLLSVTVAGATPAPDLAITAARTALTSSGHTPEQISAVMCTSVHPQGPDGWSAPHYINRHTIAQPVTSLEVRNGCVGFFTTLHLAACYLTAIPGRTGALITAADNFGTPACNRWTASNLFALADGGGAMVLSTSHGFARLLSVTATSNPHLEERHRAGEPLFPPGITTGATLNFTERTRRFQKVMTPEQLTDLGDFGQVLADTAGQALEEAGVPIDKIAVVVHDGFHFGTLLLTLFDPLGIPEELGIWEYTCRVGHAGPLDALRGLDYAWRSRRARAGEYVLLVTDAPGMEASAAVLQILDTA